MNDTAVTRWFGTGFDRLHPLLQQLHRDGGVLEGSIDLHLRGALGRHFARRIGLPRDTGRCHFSVHIDHVGDTLVWERRFGGGETLRSVFVPHGRWPDGWWTETTGPFALRLGIDVIDGGWHWRVLGARFRGIAMPLWTMPQMRAFKRIEDGRYRFAVALAMPLMGDLVRYEGLLDARPHA
jgi:hypothetical protein